MDTTEQQDERNEKNNSLKVPLFSEILDALKEFTPAHQLLARVLVNKGIISKKQFYTSFIRDIAILHLKRHPSVVQKMQCTKEDLNSLESSLFEALNFRLSELGFRLCSITDEEEGREMVALVTEDILPMELRAISGFSEDELALFARYLRQMVDCGGDCGQSWALQEGSKLPNPLSFIKTQIFIDKLIRSGWITENGGDLCMAPRAIAELEPVLSLKYGCPNCTLCQKVIVRKFAAVTCEQCHVHIHKSCWTRLCAGCEADEISCPGSSLIGCNAKFSKSEVAERFS